MIAKRPDLRPHFALILVLLLTISGCRVSEPPAEPEAQRIPAAFDPCSLLDAAEVSVALGAPISARTMFPTDVSGTECRYEAGLNRREEMLLVPWKRPVEPPAPLEPMEEGIAGLGKAARWTLTERTGTLHVRH